MSKRARSNSEASPPSSPAKKKARSMLSDVNERRRVLDGELSRADRSSSCWLSHLKPNTKGYCQPSMNGRKVITLHVLSYMHYKGELSKGMQVSHLCGHRNCFNPEHLVLETAQVNNQRKGCLVWVMCPDCNRVIVVCPHNPQCVKDRH
jgi:hypothetical protein